MTLSLRQIGPKNFYPSAPSARHSRLVLITKPHNLNPNHKNVLKNDLPSCSRLSSSSSKEIISILEKRSTSGFCHSLNCSRTWVTQHATKWLQSRSLPIRSEVKELKLDENMKIELLPCHLLQVTVLPGTTSHYTEADHVITQMVYINPALLSPPCWLALLVKHDECGDKISF